MQRPLRFFPRLGFSGEPPEQRDVDTPNPHTDILTPNLPSTFRLSAPQKEEWTALFNGRDLDGWDTWLGKPNKGAEPVGLNKDPKAVYSVTTIDGSYAARP